MTPTSSRSAAWSHRGLPFPPSWRREIASPGGVRWPAPRSSGPRHRRSAPWRAADRVARGTVSLYDRDGFSTRPQTASTPPQAGEPAGSPSNRNVPSASDKTVATQCVPTTTSTRTERNRAVLRSHRAFDDAARFSGHRRRARHLLRAPARRGQHQEQQKERQACRGRFDPRPRVGRHLVRNAGAGRMPIVASRTGRVQTAVARSRAARVEGPARAWCVSVCHQQRRLQRSAALYQRFSQARSAGVSVSTTVLPTSTLPSVRTRPSACSRRTASARVGRGAAPRRSPR